MSSAIPTFEQFKKLLRGTPMAGEARGVYDASLRGGINPAFVAGLAIAESGGGAAGYAVGRHNPYGLGVHLGWQFPTYAQATTKLAETLHGSEYMKLYKQSGARGVIGRYTPWGDASNNPNSHTSNIEKYGSSTGGNASVIYTNGQVGGVAPQVGAQPMGKMAGGGGNANLASLLALGPQVIGGDPNNPLLAKVLQSVASGGGPGRSVASTPSAGGGQQLSYGSIPMNGNQPTLDTWGGPSEHRSRALGNWQSDTAYDLGGNAGTLVTSPLGGRVVKISGAPGAPRGAQFAGYGITVDYGGGKELFFKHIGALAPGVKVGASVKPGQSIGVLESKTGGGPHLHLGATSDPFLAQVLSYYTRKK